MIVHAALFTVAIDNGDGSRLTGQAVGEMEKDLKAALRDEMSGDENYTLTVRSTPTGVIYTLNNRWIKEPLGDFVGTPHLNACGIHTWGQLGKLTQSELGELILNLKEFRMLCKELLEKDLWEETP